MGFHHLERVGEDWKGQKHLGGRDAVGVFHYFGEMGKIQSKGCGSSMMRCMVAFLYTAFTDGWLDGCLIHNPPLLGWIFE